MMELRIALPKDHAAIHTLVLETFDAPEEAALVTALRNKNEIADEWVAVAQEVVIGHLALSHMDAPAGALALAPVSVRPTAQKQGVASALIKAALAKAKSDGWTCAVVLGDPDYYSRFGFDVGRAANFETPYPNAYTGIIVFDAPKFAILPKKLIYPATFDGV